MTTIADDVYQIVAVLRALRVDDGPAAVEFPIWEVGKNYLIHTVTRYLCGKLIHVGGKELVLEDASWIADTGRFGEAFRDGVSAFKEVEYVPGRRIVGRGAIVDAAIWPHAVPMETK